MYSSKSIGMPEIMKHSKIFFCWLVAENDLTWFLIRYTPKNVCHKNNFLPVREPSLDNRNTRKSTMFCAGIQQNRHGWLRPDLVPKQCSFYRTVVRVLYHHKTYWSFNSKCQCAPIRIYTAYLNPSRRFYRWRHVGIYLARVEVTERHRLYPEDNTQKKR